MTVDKDIITLTLRDDGFVDSVSVFLLNIRQRYTWTYTDDVQKCVPVAAEIASDIRLAAYDDIDAFRDLMDRVHKPKLKV